MANIGMKINATKFNNTLTNLVKYTQGFIDEAKNSEAKLSKKISNMSIDVFYDYMDGLARSHPGMLHHVYEWGQVGDPFARLFELRMSLSGKKSTIGADFLESSSVADNSKEPFYDKAYMMEEGIPVVVDEKDAQVLFFEIDGEEFFRHGPIYIANPGGSATRGSFVRAFNDFYALYFQDFYLKSIRFYKHFSTSKEYQKNVRMGTRSRNAYNLGKRAALSWIEKAPGDN